MRRKALEIVQELQEGIYGGVANSELLGATDHPINFEVGIKAWTCDSYFMSSAASED